MLEFSKFETVFLNAKKPFWVLYKGTTKGQQIGSNLSAGRDGETVNVPSVEDSFSDLSDLISVYGDGTYTIECRSATKASRGNDTHQFYVGEQSSSRSANPTVTSHPAVGFFQGLDGKYFFDSLNGKTSELHKAQLDLLRKDMEIEALKRELKEDKEASSLPDRIFGLLEKQPAILDKILGSGAPTAIGLLKAEKPISEPRQNRVESADLDEEDYEPGRLDFNSLVEAAMEIQKALPHRHVNEIFDGLAEFITKDPVQADSYLKMLLGNDD